MNTTTLLPAHSPRRVIVIHGYGASPEAHWFPWLSDTLKRRGVFTNVVCLPAPEEPDATEWELAVTNALGSPDQSTWIVAHSLGCITAIRTLAALRGSWMLGGLVLVAGFTGSLPALPGLDGYLALDTDAERIARHISTRFMIRSDDDPFVPSTASDALSQRLGADLHVQMGAGHFLEEDGITELPLISRLILQP